MARRQAKPAPKPFASRMFDADAKPPLLVTALGVAWKWVDHVSNADFLLSISDQRLAQVFQTVLLGLGPIVFIACCGIWYLVVVMRIDRRKARPNAYLIASLVALPCFAVGAIVATSHANEAEVLRGWERVQNICVGHIDSSRLVSYKRGYKMYLVCGVSDSAVDRITDTRIHISPPFTITGGTQTITSEIDSARYAMFDRYGQWWFQVVILREDLDMNRIKSIRDVEANRGIALERMGYAGQPAKR